MYVHDHFTTVRVSIHALFRKKKNFSPLAAILKDIAKTAAFQQQTKSRKIGFK